MNRQAGQLSSIERAASIGLATALSLFALRSRSALLQIALGAAASGLTWRAATGHCAVKAALQNKASRRSMSDRVDESVYESFPASDPPASRLPDEPPVNAQAKWDAVRAAGMTS